MGNGRRRVGYRVALLLAIIVLGGTAFYSYRGQTQGTDGRRAQRPGGRRPFRSAWRRPRDRTCRSI